MNPLDLNLVRVFVVIYEAKSVTRAAQRLALTQPTISHSLARLREAYGDRLFLRSGNGLVPTVLAQQLYEPFSSALAAIEGTVEEQRGFDPRSSRRRFRLAMSDIGVLYFVPPLLRRLQDVAPNLEIEVLAISDGTQHELTSGHLDVAVGPFPSLTSSMKSVLLFQDRYLCLVSRDHPFVRSGMDISAFSKGRHIMVASPLAGHQMIDELLAQKEVFRNIAVRLPHFTVLPQMLAESDLIAILPSRVADFYAKQGRLKSLEIPVAMPAFGVSVYWHARQDNIPAHRWLVSELVQTLKQF